MRNAPAQFGYIPIATILTEKDPEGPIAGYIPALQNQGGERWGVEMISQQGPFFFFVVTGGTEKEILRLREKRKKTTPKEPVFLLAHPGENSLPAALEVLARLQQDGDKGRVFYLKSPDDMPGLMHISDAARDLEAYYAMQRARIGLVGPPSDWLVASSPDPEIVHDVWGPQVIPIPLEALKACMADVGETELRPTVDSLLSKAAELREPSKTEVSDAVRVHLALKRMSSDHQIDAVTLRCFDLVQELKTTGCFALAQLNDEGVVAGCEGDMVSTVGMLWIHKLLGRTPWMANPARIEVVDNSLLLAHCTVPRGMVEEYRLRSHFESGLGVGIQGELPSGPVTLVRIGGKSLEKLWLAEGETLQTDYAENLCRTQVKVRLTQGEVRDLLRTPLGNHLVLARGHHARRLRAWGEMMIAHRPQGGL